MQTHSTQFKQTDTNDAPGAPLRVDRITVEWLSDESPDLSWLDQTDEEMGDGFEAQSKERKESYGSQWEMTGCVAKAQVSYPIGGGSRRLEWMTSGGLWGIESDSSADYKREVEQEQLDDLRLHLEAFGVEWDESKIERN